MFQLLPFIINLRKQNQSSTQHLERVEQSKKEESKVDANDSSNHSNVRSKDANSNSFHVRRISPISLKRQNSSKSSLLKINVGKDPMKAFAAKKIHSNSALFSKHCNSSNSVSD